MNQPIQTDDFEKQLEKGRPPAAAKPVPKTPPPKIPSRPQPLSRPTGLDWLEQGFNQRQAGDAAAQKSRLAQEKNQKEQLEKLKAIDKKRSRQMYEEIQQEIRLIRQKKASQPAQNITGATGYDAEQHQNPEGFWDKVKKKQAEAKKKLPWTSKQGMGTGEITRGVSG